MNGHGTIRLSRLRIPGLALILWALLAALPAAQPAGIGPVELPRPSGESEAEETPPPAEPSVGTSVDQAVNPTQANARADDWRRRLQEISNRLQNEELDEDALVSLRDQVQEIAGSARTVEGRLEPQLQAVQARLRQLGPAPDAGEASEPAELRERRQTEEAELSRTDTALKNTRLVAVEAEQLALDISATRRDRMTERLTARGPPALSPALWSEVLSDAATGVRELGALIADTWSGAGERWASALLGTLALALALVLVSRVLARGLGSKYGVQEQVGEEPPVPQKLLRAAITALSISVLPNALLFALFVGLNAYAGLPDRLAAVLRGAFVATGVAIFVFGMARAFFAPKSPRWRILNLSDGAAAALSAHVAFVGLVLGGSVLMQTLNNTLVGAVSLDIARRIVTAFLIALFFGMSLRRLAVEWSEREEAEGEQEQHPVSVLVRMAIWASLALILGALLLGYVSLASFLAIQLVYAVTVGAVLWLLLGLSDDLITDFVRPGQPLGHALQAGFGLSAGGVKQVAVLSSGLLRLALIVLAAMLILLPWGFEADRWTGWLRAAFFGFEVGEVTVSISSILMALLLLGVGVVATRGIQGWLANRFLPNTRLDVGMRNSIRTMFGYVGVIAAGVFAFSYLGLDLENVALLAGALSVGIGFGLQSIVNNFVSGVILLAERPIKEGDWIVVGDEQGYVRKISIRSTEIETFDRGTVIVPNSDLITGTVKNWTHSSMIGRVDVTVRVAYGTPATRVHDLLLEIAREHRSVLYYPEPSVLYWDFGEGQPTFRLWAFIGDINFVYNVASDLRFVIEERFAKEGILIPFPQRDLTIKGIDRIEAALAGRGAKDAGSGSAGEDGAT